MKNKNDKAYDKTLFVGVYGRTDQQPDGTILVKGKKTYLNDENGESLGAAWYDLWMTPDGKVIRRTKPLTADQL